MKYLKIDVNKLDFDVNEKLTNKLSSILS